eukprot:12421614-Ditylum_brightwellii.AAC.1
MDKQNSALALLTYLASCPSCLSRLALLVIVGYLLSMVPATPTNVGATYLQKSYNVLHEDDGSQPPDVMAVGQVPEVLFISSLLPTLSNPVKSGGWGMVPI